VHAVAGSAKLGVADALDVDLTLGPDLYENLLRSISQALVECLGDKSDDIRLTQPNGRSNLLEVTGFENQTPILPTSVSLTTISNGNGGM
jgi:hypothetical protein